MGNPKRKKEANKNWRSEAEKWLKVINTWEFKRNMTLQGVLLLGNNQLPGGNSSVIQFFTTLLWIIFI